MNVTVRHVAPRSAPRPSFADMYERATTIMEARIGELRCDDATALARAWILAQAWFVNDFSVRSVYLHPLRQACRFSMTRSPCQWENLADTAALLVPSGGTPEAFAAKHVNDQGARHLDEIYVDFEDADTSRDVTVSYGEYVASCDEVDYAAIVQRAETRARFHYQTLSVPDGSGKLPFDILRREWTCLSTNKTADAMIATIHVYFRI